MIGTSAMSSNSSIDRAARPTGVCVPAIGSTNAVDESASARPRPSAPVQCCPISISSPASSSPIPASSSAPSPKTSRRIVHKRLNDSSRPMVNSSSVMPNSANGSNPSGSVMVTHLSQSFAGTILPRP